MNNLDKTGKIIYALPFGVFGIIHLIAGDKMVGIVPSFLPGDVIWVYLAGLALLATSISMLTGKMEKAATMLLGVLMLIFVLTVHLPGVLAEADSAQMALGGLLKDLSLAGAAFYLSAKAA